MAIEGIGRGLGFAAGMGRFAARLVQALRARHVVGRLGALDDRMLADIGITRHDVASVLAEPLLVDPSEVLARRAHEARRGRRAAVLDQMIATAPVHPADTARRAA